MVARTFQMYEPKTDSWVEGASEMPVLGHRRVRVWITSSRRGAADDEWDCRTTSFTKSQRRAVLQAMSDLAVSEVYSPPRIAPMAPQAGFRQGVSADLETGWDFSKEADRKAIRRRLASDSPALLILCPPCTAFSVVQNLNFPKMPAEKVAQIVEVGMLHLEFAMELAAEQIRRGDYFIFEQPHSARSWQTEVVQRLLQHPEVLRVRCDMCAYGLQVDESGGFNRKPRSWRRTVVCLRRSLAGCGQATTSTRRPWKGGPSWRRGTQRHFAGRCSEDFGSRCRKTTGGQQRASLEARSPTRKWRRANMAWWVLINWQKSETLDRAPHS